MQGEGERLCRARLERYFGTGSRDPFRAVGAEWGEFFANKAREIGALPPALGEQRVGARQRADAPIDRGGIGFDVLGAGQPHDRLHERQRIARAMIDLARQ